MGEGAPVHPASIKGVGDWLAVTPDDQHPYFYPNAHVDGGIELAWPDGSLFLMIEDDVVEAQLSWEDCRESEGFQVALAAIPTLITQIAKKVLGQ